MRSDEAYRACLDGKRVELLGKEVVIDNGGILCWKSSGTRVAIAPETLCDWELFKPEEPSEPETEELRVAPTKDGFLHVFRCCLQWNLAHILTHKNFVRLNFVLPDGTKASFPADYSWNVPTKLWWHPITKRFHYFPDFKHGYTIPVLPSSVTMLVDKEAVQNERRHDSRD